MRIEQIIKENDRTELYDYYLHLGYEHKVAAALTLFTYGRYRFTDLSIDELYEALCKGEEYIPPEEIARREQAERERLEWERERQEWERDQQRQQRLAQRRKQRLARRLGRNKTAAVPTASRSSKIKDYDDGVAYRRFTGSIDMADYMGEASVCVNEASACVTPGLSAPRGPARLSAASILGGTPDGLDHPFDTDEYEPIEEKNARTAAFEQTSTFRMTTNTASAGVVLNQLRNDRRIDRSMVRIEEMMNYFRYETVLPTSEMFGISTEIMDAGEARKYLYINVQGREEVKDRQNIIVLLDVSGSMTGNAEQTQAAIATIISKLGNGDKFSLITYSDEDHVELEAFTINGPEDRRRALEKLLSIEIFGCTWGSKGIERAYKIGKKNYIKGGNNQVILITDGDLNFGITDKGGLTELIEKKKKNNLFLSVIGTGLDNYKDDKLEALCKHGNGVYRVVNNLADVPKSIDEEYSSLVNIIAKDVKAKVEFNPQIVESYRLLGFENREIAREDFTNDKVISEPFGSGGYGVAVYELKMRTGDAPVESGLKYSRIVTTDSQEPATVKVRYKQPLEDVSCELEKALETADASYTDNLRLAFIVYVCAEKLRGSDKISEEEIDLAKKLYQELGQTIREKNEADLYKLEGVLDKSPEELGIGIRDEEDFLW